MTIATKTFVLSTCQEIYNTTKKVFPGVKAKVIMHNQMPHLQLILKDHLNPLVLTNAVIKQTFKRELGLLASSLFKSTIVYKLVLQDFTLSGELSDFHVFQRNMYEQNKRCSDVLISYLSTSAIDKLLKLEKLKRFGLAPEQIDQHITEDVRVYFFQLLDKIGRMEKPLREHLTQALKTDYPNIYQMLRAETIEQARAAIPKSVNLCETIAKQLRERVFGQNLATGQLAALLSRHQDREENGCYLFVGPTGVGKTELAKAIAAVKNYSFVFLEMQGCSDSSSVGKFWGVGPGYIGSTDKPHFMKELDKICNPQFKKDKDCYEIRNAVILFDELEKAHRSVQLSLLSLLDEGCFTFSYTTGISNLNYGSNISRKYRFINCIFIGTSNLFQNPILEAFQRELQTTEIVTLFKTLNQSNIEGYAQELLGRLEIVPFGPIRRGECYQEMIRSKLEVIFADLKKCYSFKEVTLENEPLLLDLIENKFYRNGTDIRSMKRSLATNINDIISNHISEWRGLSKDLTQIKLTLSCLNDELALQAFFFSDQFFDYGCIGTYQIK